jgi:DNA polymerase III sliding clamp (beta) subunit (PCNA family)
MFTFSMPYSDAWKIAKKIAHSMSTDANRYYLNGFFVHRAEGGEHYAVSTDGHKLTRIRLRVGNCSQGDFPAVIFPTQTVKQIESIKLSLIEKQDCVVEFRVNADQHRYEVECLGQTFGGKLAEGNFPDYMRVIPSGWREFTNEYGECGFSPIYLAEIMKAASYDAVKFKASTSGVRMFFENGSPGVVVEEKDPSVLYVIMPMRTSMPKHERTKPRDTEGGKTLAA